MITFFRKVWVFIFLIPATVQANQIYTVQVGAYDKVSKSKAENFSQYGEVIQQPYSSLVRVSIGKFSERSDAEKKLIELKSHGFSDAFIRKFNTEHLSHISNNKNAIELHEDNNLNDHIHFKKGNIDIWNNLTDEQKNKAVYLDGILHIKDGDKFIPIN